VKRLIVAAPQGPLRGLLKDYFASRVQVCSLERERIIDEQQLVVDDRQVLVQGQDLLQGSLGALILDSGFMTPLPQLCPSEQEWGAARDHFDDYLRTDRERASLWYSVMAILNDRLPCCFNSQASFAAAAMKPWALMSLAEAEVPTLPFVTSNDPTALESFSWEHPGELRRLPWLPGEDPSWLHRADLNSLPLEAEPVILQAAQSRQALQLLLVGQKLFVADQALADSTELSGLERLLAPLGPILSLEWAELSLLPWQGKWHVADFSPAPRLDRWPAQMVEQVLDALWRALQARADEAGQSDDSRTGAQP
jgi:hypothetical protein